MQAIELLHNRVSSARLESPAPNAEQLEVMYQAAARAPDHALLRPWRLIVLENEQLVALGEVFVQANLAKNSELNALQLQKIAAKPLRAPMIITVVAHITEHPKVPELEQLITAGCAAHAIELAAFAQGLGAMWRSGGMMFDNKVKQGLGLAENEQIIGFLYLGKSVKVRQVTPVDSADFVSTAKILNT
ncbi:MAG: nitroreductase family protein [Oceanospirillaceae bacterium]|nr:nitroreductase family protein [Oceanospirillaceae bacterium]